MPATASKELWRYGEPRRHEIVSDLIRAHSTNHEDIREAVLRGVDFRGVREVLELGCGFGFMSGVIASRLGKQARITGVDACRDNRGPFSRRVESAGCRASFICMSVGHTLPWRDEVYDLCVASHSLYYFPQVISEVARVLSPGGRFLALTHGMESALALSRVGGLSVERSPLARVAGRFSAKNGAELLGRSFAQVDAIEYRNSLVFSRDEVDELLLYLRFKFRALTEWPESEPELHRLDTQNWVDAVFGDGPVTIDKTDVAFWASDPLWEPGRPEYEAWHRRHRIPDDFWPM